MTTLPPPLSREAVRFSSATAPSPPLMKLQSGAASQTDISAMTEAVICSSADTVVCIGDAEILRLGDARSALKSRLVANFSLEGGKALSGPGTLTLDIRASKDTAQAADLWMPLVPQDAQKRSGLLRHERALGDMVFRCLNADSRLRSAEAAFSEAMEDMAELDKYADEKNLPPLSPVAKESARIFLRKVALRAPRRYAVSPWDNGEIVVHTRGAKGFGVGVYFNAEGGASCHVTCPGSEGREAHYLRADNIPDEFVLAALRSLGT